MDTTARSAQLIEHGQPLRVVEVDLGGPGPDEVVVDVVYGAVNPVDRYVALGRLASDAPRPRTLGSEGVGRVDGRAVIVRGRGIGFTRDGLWSTRAVVPTDALIEVPDGVGLDVASAIGVAGVTAWRTVTELARVTDVDRVLVLGASGGVGSVAVSVAHGIGATVWGQTGGAEKAGWVSARGADRVVVADAAELVEQTRELQPTVVIDPLGGDFFAAAIEVLEQRGRLVILGTSSGPRGDVPLQVLYRKAITVYGYAGLLESDDDMTRHIGDVLDAVLSGRLEIVVDRTLPLDEINLAFELLEGRRVKGKLLIDLSA